MTRLFSFVLIFWILFLSSCITTTDIDVDITTNIYSSIKGEAAVTVEVCEDLELTSPEPEEPKDKESGLLGKWDTCESHDDCETALCFCFMCVDITDFLN